MYIPVEYNGMIEQNAIPKPFNESISSIVGEAISVKNSSLWACM